MHASATSPYVRFERRIAHPACAVGGAGANFLALRIPVPVSRSPAIRMSDPVVHAPDFKPGLEWINTGGDTPTIVDLRGKIALLDFWTYG